MDRTVARYLERKTLFDQWPLTHSGRDWSPRVFEGRTSSQGYAPTPPSPAVIVIPALAESPHLFNTLQDLAEQQEPWRSRTLVIVVVNNRAAPAASEAERKNNVETLTALTVWRSTHPELPLAWIDAATDGHELPEKEGVGLARKLGLDWGLRLLAEQNALDAPLISLDADTRVSADYLTAIHAFFAEQPRWAAVIPFAHPIPAEPMAAAAIVSYELFLRYHELSLAWAGSPFAFQTVGSAMACTARAYAAVSGVPRKRAGEDFYFLQQLAKTGPIAPLSGVRISPSPRASNRVPFGTGRSVGQYLDGRPPSVTAYHPDSYDILRRWLAAMDTVDSDDAGEVMTAAAMIAPGLATFLEQQKLPRVWQNINAHARSRAQLRRQRHGWFDGFRTLKLLHHLREQGYPDIDLDHAVRRLLARLTVTPPGDTGSQGRLALLHRLRDICEERAATRGLYC